MITGELRSKIDSLWEIFWTGGLTNPLDVIEQMTYLMFIRDLDDADNIKAKESAMLGLPYQSIFAGEVQVGGRAIDGNQLKWSVFHDFPAGRMYEVVQNGVFPFIKNLHGNKESAYSKYMGDAIFKIPTQLMLDKIVSAMDVIYEQMAQLSAADTRGDVYEYLLSKLATAGVNGQFRTPRHIIRMMVALMQPKPDDVICDPACGTSGFLVAAGEWLKENRRQEIFFNRQNKDHYMNHMFYGYDMDRTMLRIGAMNMMTHGVENPFIEYRDSLSDQNPDREKYSLILANPPFKGSLDYDIPDPGQSAVQGQPGLRHRIHRPYEGMQNKEDGAAFPCAVPAYAEGGRALRVHCAGRRAVRLLHGAQGHPQGTGGEPSPGGGDLHALGRVQALRGRVHRHPDLHQDGPRRHGSRVVLRHEGGRLHPGRQAHPHAAKRYSRRDRPLPQPCGRGEPPAHGAELSGAQGGDCGQWV